jgi:hypothetical protein
MPISTKATDRRRTAADNEASRFLNRELSWLDFNERVLALAEDQQLPLLERVKFAAIFAGNLDEFYQVRVATLRRQELAAPGLVSADGLDATTQLRRIAERTDTMAVRHAPPSSSGSSRSSRPWPSIRVIPSRTSRISRSTSRSGCGIGPTVGCASPV